MKRKGTRGVVTAHNDNHNVNVFKTFTVYKAECFKRYLRERRFKAKYIAINTKDSIIHCIFKMGAWLSG